MADKDILHDKYELLWSRLIKKGYLFSKDKWHYSSNVAYDDINKFIKYVRRYYKNANRVLDIGVGNARNSIVFAKNGFEVWGIDLSESAIKFAKYNAKLNNVKLHLSTCDILSTLPFEDNFFDIIIDCGCFHHIKEKHWPEYIKNVKRVLKKDGYFFFLGFSKNTGTVGKFGRNAPTDKNYSERNGHYYHYFDENEINKIFGPDLKNIKTYEIRRSDSPIYFTISYLKYIKKEDINEKQC